MKLDQPGVDFAWGAVNARALKAAGMKFGISYLSHDTTGKNLTMAELHALWDVGLFAGLVWEATSGRALQGFAAGAADAAEARRQADALKLGFPIAFAVDFDVTPAQKAAVTAYFKGVRSVLPRERVGVYGDYWMVKHLVEHGDPCITYWQTYAWSGGLVHPRAIILQYSNGHTVGGLGVDFDKAARQAFYLFLRGPSAPPRPRPAKNQRKIAVWRHHLHELQDVARLIGWTPAMLNLASKLKGLIARG